MQLKIPCVVMRGGTSRAVIFNDSDLPKDKKIREQVFLSAMGSPDPKQIDGLGGGTSSTSKVAIVAKSKRPDADLDYTFVQLGVGNNTIDYSGNCGNISSAVAPFAVTEGLIAGINPRTSVRIFNTNTGQLITSEIETPQGKYEPEGKHTIPGVIQKGSPIILTFHNPINNEDNLIFPTRNKIDYFNIEGQTYLGTLLNITNPYLFVRAHDFGLTGYEGNKDKFKQIELLQQIRDVAAAKMGINSKTFPKVIFISSPQNHEINGKLVEANSFDIAARTISFDIMHKTIPLTAALCLTAASTIQGTIVNEMLENKIPNTGVYNFRIAHPEGIITITANIENGNISDLVCTRTARIIMKGYIYANISSFE